MSYIQPLGTVPTLAALATPSTVPIGGYSAAETQDTLDNAKTLQNYTALRAYTGRALSVRITSTGVAGLFWRDASDTTSVDNGGTIIVDASSRRWKRFIQDHINVHWFGAVGNNSGDDTTAINAAINATMLLSFPLPVFFPNGVYYISSTLVIKTNLVLLGQSKNGVTLKSKDGIAAFPMLQTLNFVTLLNSNTAAGAYKWAVRNIVLDGNRWNMLAATGPMTALFEVYGYDYDIADVDIFNSKARGFFSEWCTAPGVPVAGGGDSMESRIERLKIYYSSGNGFVFRGPHDSMISKLISFINDESNITIQDGATYTAGGTHLTDAHSYYNGEASAGTPSGVYIDSIVILENIQCETARKGSNFQIGPLGRVVGSNIRSFLCTLSGQAGVIIGSNGNVLNGLHIESNTGTGLFISGNQNIVNGAIVNGNGGVGVQLTGNDNKVQNIPFSNTGGNLSNTGTGNTVT